MIVVFVQPDPSDWIADFSALSTQLVDPITRQPFPNNQIPADRISPVAKYFLGWIPQPNRAGRELNFVGTEQVETENQFMGKVEYNRERHQISARYFFTDYDRPAVIPVPKFGPSLVAGREAAEALLYTGRRVRPRVLLADGYTFAHPDLETALRALLGR